MRARCRHAFRAAVPGRLRGIHRHAERAGSARYRSRASEGKHASKTFSDTRMSSRELWRSWAQAKIDVKPLITNRFGFDESRCGI